MPARVIKDKKKALRYRLRQVRAHLWRLCLCRSTFIAITGSCGKTTATHLLGQILATRASCHVGIDRNTFDQVVKSVLRADPHQRYVVQEAAGSEPGALIATLRLLRPRIGIVTTIGQDHFTSFRTPEATAHEKARVVRALPKKGVAVLNADDPLVLAMADLTRARVLTYGRSADADLVAADVRFTWPGGLSFTAAYRGEQVRVETHLFGELWLTAVLAALAGGLAAGFDLQCCVAALRGAMPYRQRMTVHRTAAGGWIINDTFKAPYWSIPAAMETLADLPAARKTIVLGSISDTPGASSPKYRQLARTALQIADRVVFVGENARHVAKPTRPELAGRLVTLASAEDACAMLSRTAVADEFILVKANGADRLDRVVDGQFRKVVCWKSPCALKIECRDCTAGASIATPLAAVSV